MVWLLKDIIGLTNDSEALKEFTQPMLVIIVVNTTDTVSCAVANKAAVIYKLGKVFSRHILKALKQTTTHLLVYLGLPV